MKTEANKTCLIMMLLAITVLVVIVFVIIVALSFMLLKDHKILNTFLRMDLDMILLNETEIFKKIGQK